MKIQENETFSGRYKLIQKLGVGGFAEVWLAEDSYTDNSKVAIKIYAPNGGLDNQGIKIFSKEYAMLQDLNNQFLLKALHFDIIDDKPYLVMPYCPNGSLLNKLHEQGSLSEEELARVIFQVSTALAYLHDNGIIHQDIKPANILINRNNEYVISDFGISNNMRRTLRKSVGVASTSMSPEYAPPERFSSNPQSLPAGDIFSLGVLIYEMATGDVPWMGMGGLSLSRGAEIPGLPDKYSNHFKNWVSACMSLDPLKRPNAKDLIKASGNYLEEGYWLKYKISPVQNPAEVGTSNKSGRKTQRQFQQETFENPGFTGKTTKQGGLNQRAEKSGTGKTGMQGPGILKLGGAVLFAIVVVLSGYFLFFADHSDPDKLFNDATRLMADGEILKAEQIFLRLKDIKGQEQRVDPFLNKIKQEKEIIASTYREDFLNYFNNEQYIPAWETWIIIESILPADNPNEIIMARTAERESERQLKELEILVSEGKQLANELKFDAAIQNFKRAVQIHPVADSLHLTLSGLKIKNNDYNNCLKLLKEAESLLKIGFDVEADERFAKVKNDCPGLIEN